jgi:hypothetical protein
MPAEYYSSQPAVHIHYRAARNFRGSRSIDLHDGSDLQKPAAMADSIRRSRCFSSPAGEPITQNALARFQVGLVGNAEHEFRNYFGFREQGQAMDPKPITLAGIRGFEASPNRIIQPGIPSYFGSTSLATTW